MTDELCTRDANLEFRRVIIRRRRANNNEEFDLELSVSKPQHCWGLQGF